MVSSSLILFGIIIGAAVAASITVYGYATSVGSNIVGISSENTRSNARIQAHDASQIFANTVDSVRTNLLILASSQSVQTGEISRARPLFAAAQNGTGDFTDTYFWVDADGKLLWANAFSNSTLYKMYVGQDRSNREYYQVPKETHQPFASAVIESVDGVPRIYYSYPIITRAPTGEARFNGVVASASNLPHIAALLKRQLPVSQNNVGLIDKNGVVLYASTPNLIGKNYRGPELAAILPDEIKQGLYSILDKSLQGGEGTGDIAYQGNTATIAYSPVYLLDRQFAVLYVTAPHIVTSEASNLLNAQRNLSTVAIVLTAAAAIGVTLLIFTWNKRLNALVSKRTEELRKSNESMAESNKRLEDANERLAVNDKLQREFINIAAHELRTPITPILVSLHLARRVKNADGTFQTVLQDGQAEMIHRNAKRLEKLANDILSVTRIEAKGLDLTREPIDMNVKIANVLADARAFVPIDKKINFFFEPTKEPVIVYADKSKLFEVLSNLIKNSIRFVQEDKGEIRVSLTKSDDGKNAVISVTDNGSGISSETLPRLFQKFAASSDMGGTGLGLYIAKAIVEAHGGTISGENNGSNGNEGATFTFTLPLASQQDAP